MIAQVFPNEYYDMKHIYYKKKYTLYIYYRDYSSKDTQRHKKNKVLELNIEDK